MITQPTPHPCNSCFQQKKMERLQGFIDSRLATWNTTIEEKKCQEPLTGLHESITDIRDTYCDGCPKPSQYADRFDEPYAKTAPTDDNVFVAPIIRDVYGIEKSGGQFFRLLKAERGQTLRARKGSDYFDWTPF